MKVLMFGWEFPPHISGGLGTACEGLTNALVEENVDLVFVVPKAFGDERQDHFTLLDASSTFFPIMETQQPEQPDVVGTLTIALPSGTTEVEAVEEIVIKKSQKGVKVLEVPSTLSAYGMPQKSAYTVYDWVVSWNEVYQFAKLKFHSTSGQVEENPKPLLSKRMGTHPFSGGYGLLLFEEILRYAEVASEIARGYSTNIIHVHDWMTFPAGLAAKAATGNKLIVHVHATEVDRSGGSPDPVIRNIEMEGFKGADHIIAVSEWTRQILIKHYQVKASRISVIHNGLRTRELPVPEVKRWGSHLVTFLGRVTYQKGPIYFVHAAFKVLERFPDAHFVIAGSGDLYEQMIEEVAHLRLSRQFHFTGFLKGPGVDKLWALSDVYVMPSVSEPFGITPLEAIQAGVPVIVSKQSGVSEVMPHALMVDFWDTDALANAICGVLAYKALSETLKKNSREAVKNITWNKSAKKLKSLYTKFV